MTQNVIFDVGAVLVDWNPRYLYSKLLPDEDAVEAFLDEIGFREWNVSLDAGGRWDTAVQELSTRHPHRRDLIEAAHLRWHEMVPGAIDGSVEILEALAAKEVPLYAITNYSSEKWVETVKRFPFLRLFRDVVVSGDEGLTKPNPQIYHICLSRNGLEPESCIFIDDSRKNVEAANAIGIRGIHFESSRQLHKDLARLGFLP